MPKIGKKEPTRAENETTRAYQSKLPMVGGAFAAVAEGNLSNGSAVRRGRPRSGEHLAWVALRLPRLPSCR
jgi:hypothetical protein